MKCPRCGYGSSVLATRQLDGGVTRRDRLCSNMHRFSTFEAVAPLAAVRGWVRKQRSGEVGAASRTSPAKKSKALELLAEGMTHARVAKVLQLSSKTIQRILHHA